MKKRHPYKGYVITYNVEIFKCFNREIQIKNTESAIGNKLKYV